jgi:hypothetical protein
LTKDDLVKRQWKGCTRCCFCSEQETIQHLFFDCPMARLMRCAISVTFGVTKPANTANLFGPWLRIFWGKQRALVLIGWLLFVGCYGSVEMKWYSKKSKFKSFLQVMFRGTYWIRSLSILSREEGRKILKEGCRCDLVSPTWSARKSDLYHFN